MWTPANPFMLNSLGANKEDQKIIWDWIQQENPWEDKFLDELLLLKFSFMVQKRKGNREQYHRYWRHMSIKEQVLIESEFIEACEAIKSIDYMIKSYIIDTYHESLFSDKLKSAPWATNFSPKESAVWESDDEAQLDSILNIHGAWQRYIPKSGGVTAEVLSILKATGADLTDLFKLHRDNRSLLHKLEPLLREWRVHGYELYNDGINSNILLTQHLNFAKRYFNKLTGVSGRIHTLLVDDGIPHPDQATFLAWYTLCGAGFHKLDENVSATLEQYAGFKPAYMLAYVLPFIPRTHEHVQGGGIQNADSDASNSLTIKSQGHKRDPEGRLDYGIWQARFALFSADGKKANKFMQWNLVDMTNPMRGLLALAYQVLPANRRYKTKSVWANVPDWCMKVMPAYGSDSLDWAENHSNSIDSQFIFQSSIANRHFRFDTMKSADAWATAFETSGIQWLLANRNQKNQWLFRSIVRQLRSMRDERIKQEQGGLFDLRGLNRDL